MTKGSDRNSHKLENEPLKHGKGKQPMLLQKVRSAFRITTFTNARRKLQLEISGKNARKAITGDNSSSDEPEPAGPIQARADDPLDTRWFNDKPRVTIATSKSMDLPAAWWDVHPALRTPATLRQAAQASLQYQGGVKRESRSGHCVSDSNSPRSDDGFGLQPGRSRFVFNDAPRSALQVPENALSKALQLNANSRSSITLLAFNDDLDLAQQSNRVIAIKGQLEQAEERQLTNEQSEQLEQLEWSQQLKRTAQSEFHGSARNDNASVAPELLHDKRWWLCPRYQFKILEPTVNVERASPFRGSWGKDGPIRICAPLARFTNSKIVTHKSTNDYMKWIWTPIRMRHWQHQYEDKSRPPESKPQLLSISEQRLSTILFEDKAWFRRGYKIKDAPLNCNHGLHPWLWASAASAVSAVPSEQMSISYDSTNPETFQNSKARPDSSNDSLISIDHTGMPDASYRVEQMPLKIQDNAAVPITHCANNRYSGESPAGPSRTNPWKKRASKNMAGACISTARDETDDSYRSRSRKGFCSWPNKTSTCINSPEHYDSNPSDSFSLQSEEESEYITDDFDDDTTQLQSPFQRHLFLGHVLSVIGETEEPPTDEAPCSSQQQVECRSLRSPEAFANQSHIFLPKEFQSKRHDEALGAISPGNPDASTDDPEVKWKAIAGPKLPPLYHAQHSEESQIKLGTSSQLFSVGDEYETQSFAEELKRSIEAEYARHTIFQMDTVTNIEQLGESQSTSDAPEQGENQQPSKESKRFNAVEYASCAASQLDAADRKRKEDDNRLIHDQRRKMKEEKTSTGNRGSGSLQARIATWAATWAGIHKIASWHCRIEGSEKLATTLEPGPEPQLAESVDAQDAPPSHEPYRSTAQLRNEHSL